VDIQISDLTKIYWCAQDSGYFRTTIFLFYCSIGSS